MKNPLIIDEPSLQTLKQRYAYSFLTVALWALWIYLWLPLVSLLAWLIGFDIFYKEMIQDDGFASLMALMGSYAIAVVGLAGSLLGWAVYNSKRFKGKERRSFSKVTENSVIGEYFSVDASKLDLWQQEKNLIVRYDDQGVISAIEINKANDDGESI